MYQHVSGLVEICKNCIVYGDGSQHSRVGIQRGHAHCLGPITTSQKNELITWIDTRFQTPHLLITVSWIPRERPRTASDEGAGSQVYKLVLRVGKQIATDSGHKRRTA